MSIQNKLLDLSIADLQYASFDGSKIITQGKYLIGELEAPETDDNHGYNYMLKGFYNGDEYEFSENKYWYNTWFVKKNGVFIWKMGQDYYTKVLP